MKLLPWYILPYWYKGPALTIHNPRNGKVVVSWMSYYFVKHLLDRLKARMVK